VNSEGALPPFFIQLRELMKNLESLGAIASMESVESVSQPNRTVSTFNQRPVVAIHDYSNLSVDSVGSFLRSLRRYPLLQADEEIELARHVRRFMVIEKQRDRLTQQLGRIPTESELADRLATSDRNLKQQRQEGQAAKRRIICSNLRLVVAIAKKYTDQNVPLPDLIQEGVLGLNRAVEKFDPERGYRFSTYAYGWIQQRISQSIASNFHTVRLPHQVLTKINKLKRVGDQFHKEFGRNPTRAEVASVLDISPRQLLALQRVRHRAVSLNHSVNEEENTELLDLLEDTAQSPEEWMAENQLRQEIWKIVSEVLTPQEQDILFSLFGLFQNEAYPLPQVSRMFNLSQERVLSLKKAAIRKLRRPPVSKRLRSLLNGEII
jgi:RNA polymerase primary sigma factor